MKKFSYLIVLTALVASMTTACSDWGDHYDDSGVSTDMISIYNGDIVSYMKNTADVSQFSSLLQEAGIYDSVFSDKNYTFIVCDNNVFSTAASNINRKAFARYSVADMAVAPNALTEGLGILTRSGKNVWIYGEGSNARFDEYTISKVVKTTNGYIYYINGVMPIRSSVYEYLNSLGAEYSRFRELVAKYEENFFDREHSAPIGVNEAGMTVYDSVFVIHNSLMDRYTADGIDKWNMRSESYLTTMFIPTNEQIDNALKNALDSIPAWLNREATDADREKFEQWIVKACFADRELQDKDVQANAQDFQTAGGYKMVIDRQADETTYKEEEAAWWRPSVQTVNVASRVNLSNGAAYYCTNLKIPNHVIIYRIKSRFYELWNSMTSKEQEQYFRWSNLTAPMIVNDAQGEFFLSATLPTIYYHVLTAIPTTDAIADSLRCGVDFDGLTSMYDGRGNIIGVQECNLPAGEYYLRMGFVHSLAYTLSIKFNDSLIVKNMAMNAHGANYHFDRSGASDIPNTGIWKAAYPEGYDPADWIEINENASAYDTDGYTMGIVNLKQNGNFHITIDSPDIGYLYTEGSGRTKNDKNQLMMYHWCLRPTHNNY